MKEIKSNKNKRMGKGKIVALAVLGVVVTMVVAVILIFVFNPTLLSHVRAAYLFFTNSKEELENNLQNIKADGISKVQEVGLNLTKEADEALASGLITSEQFKDVLVGKIELDDAIAQNNPENESVKDDNVKEQNPSDETQDETEGQPKPEKKPQTNTDKVDKTESKPVNKPTEKPKNETTDKTNKNDNVDEQIAELVTKMYVLKSTYIGQIEGIVNMMKSEFSQLPADKQTKSAKQSIAGKYMSQINSMEAQCDAQVNAVVTELEQLLKKSGRDNSLAEAIKSTYVAEKDNTKAYYVATYGD